MLRVGGEALQGKGVVIVWDDHDLLWDALVRISGVVEEARRSNAGGVEGALTASRVVRVVDDAVLVAVVRAHDDVGLDT